MKMQREEYMQKNYAETNSNACEITAKKIRSKLSMWKNPQGPDTADCKYQEKKKETSVVSYGMNILFFVVFLVLRSLHLAI